MKVIIASILAGLLGLVLICAAGFLGAIPMYFLWNWLMPELFELKELTFLQSWGMVFMCGILFNSSNSSSNN